MSDAPCRTDLGPLTKRLLEQQQEIERLRAERDEARRIALALQIQLQQIVPGPKYEKPADTARRIAEERCWDCFKEDGK
jgi:hypothetical protein